MSPEERATLREYYQLNQELAFENSLWNTTRHDVNRLLDALEAVEKALQEIANYAEPVDGYSLIQAARVYAIAQAGLTAVSSR